MMTKRQWFFVLCLFILYLMMGAGVFFSIETEEERKKLQQNLRECREIEVLMDELLSKTAPPQKEEMLFKKLTNYCGKPIMREMSSIPNLKKWDFYHSLFFVITVVSTIGYGNLAPTTMFGRIFMIFYGLIGIPLNGIVMVTLGQFFGKSFTKLYHRWKSSKMQEDTTRLGLISQIVLYAVPGFTFFIFLPSGVMVLFEGWAYDVAVYYCFVTLTTIGFGDYVAGVENVNEFAVASHWVYKIFLLIWVIGGLGYVVMILGFITQVMQSKKMQELEHVITTNIKKTPLKIRQELRSLLQEFLFTRVKPVYRSEMVFEPQKLEHSVSCPDLTIFRNWDSPSMARKRAFSECPRSFILQRIQSESELGNIDKEATFQEDKEFKQQADLLMNLVDALAMESEGICDSRSQYAYDGFTDEEILASEKYTPSAKDIRRRAISDIRVPSSLKSEVPWMSQEEDRKRTLSEPNNEIGRPPGNFLTKLKNYIIPSRSDESKINQQDVERQDLSRRRASMFTTTSSAESSYLQRTRRGRPSVMSVAEQEAVLEQTSIADFIRALSAITVPETLRDSPKSPQRKLGTASLAQSKVSPPRSRRLAIRPTLQNRRSSLMPDTPSYTTERRFSLRPVEENFAAAPPPYSALPAENLQTRRYSRIAAPIPVITVSPVQRQVNHRKDSSKSDSVI